jgi:hypothetical protein
MTRAESCASYREWLRDYVPDHTLREWLAEDAKLITEGKETASICKGPYPIVKAESYLMVKVRLSERLQWYAEELERRENGGEAAPKVRV